MKNLMLYALALIVGMFAGPGLAEAQRYPTRPVRIIIPFPPGEAADIIARLIQPVISERMGQLSLATNGEGGYPHLAFEYFASMAGFKFLHVPYKGAAMIVPDVNAKLKTAGLLVANESADYFQKFVRSEYDKYGKLVRSIGLEGKL